MRRPRVLLYVRGSASRRSHQRISREKVGNMAVQISPTGQILVGTDGSPASVAAVRWAGREAQLRGMRVHVVYVRDMRRPSPAHYAPQPRAAEGTGPAAGESTLRQVVREAFGAQSEGVQMELADGPPARILLER